MLEILRLHCPSLSTSRFRSATFPEHTLPNFPLLGMVVAIFGHGTVPSRATFVPRGWLGSLLNTVIVPGIGTVLLQVCEVGGANVTGKAMVASAVKVKGRETVGGRKSVVVVILLITRLQELWLVTLRLMLDCPPGHTLPKFPLFTIVALMLGAGALPFTCTVADGFTGSFDEMVRVPVMAPVVVPGVSDTCTGKHKSGLTTKG